MAEVQPEHVLAENPSDGGDIWGWDSDVSEINLRPGAINVVNPPMYAQPGRPGLSWEEIVQYVATTYGVERLQEPRADVEPGDAVPYVEDWDPDFDPQALYLVLQAPRKRTE